MSERESLPATVDADGIGVSFGQNRALDDVSLRADAGEVVGLIGPNGSGKTTLLRTLYGSLDPDHGTVRFDGRDLASMRRRELAKSIAVVAQEPASDLPLMVADAVLLGRTPHLSLLQRHSRRDVRIAAQALHRVGATHLARRGFDHLSGGEKQRVLIARALTQQPRCLLMDEPTNHLDIHYQHDILQLVRSLRVTTVVVLHDLNLAARYCDRLVVLEQGHRRAFGTPDEALRPEVLGSVYGVTVDTREASDGVRQYLFRHSSAPADAAHQLREAVSAGRPNPGN